MGQSAVRLETAPGSGTGASPASGRFLYVLPHADFFWPGLTGQVAHAQGILQGVADECDTVALLAAPAGAELLRPGCPRVRFEHTVRPGRLWTIRFFRRVLELRSQVDYMVIRSEPRFLFLLALARLVLGDWPVVCVEVNGLGFSFARKGGGNPVLIALVTRVYQLLLRSCDVIYAVNRDLARRLSSGLLGVPTAKIAVVHNGGPAERFLPARELKRRELHLFFFGLLHPYNDFACLLDAAERVRAAGVTVTVHIAGEGSERGYLESRRRGDELRLYGRLSRDEFASIVQAASGKRVGVACMRYGNGSGSVSPLKVFDYMALGLPVIYSDNILRDILVDGEQGIAYRERDAGSLADAMLRSVDTAAYERMASAVRAHYPAHTWKARMRALVAALREAHG